MSDTRDAVVEEVRAATAEMIGAIRAADTDGIARDLARRGRAVDRLAVLDRQDGGAGADERRALDEQAGQALDALVDLREGARLALDALAHSAAAIRSYESIPAGGQALDQSA